MPIPCPCPICATYVLKRDIQIMQGYWNRPEETQQVLKDVWLFTGDIGIMDEDGFIRIVDRKRGKILRRALKDESSQAIPPKEA